MKKYFVAGFDVLGYSNRVRGNDKTIFILINDSVNYVKKILSKKYNFQLKVFSDNYLFYSECNCEGVFLATALMQAKLACSGIFIRGVILYDDLIITDDFVYGEGIIKTGEMEKTKVIYPRIIVDESFSEYIQSRSNESEILDLYLTTDNNSVLYIDYLEMLQHTSKDGVPVIIEFGDVREEMSLSFTDELDAHRHYIEEEIARNRNNLEEAMLKGNLDEAKIHSGIKEKFLWVMKYHNKFCIKHGYHQHLIVGNMCGDCLEFSHAEIGSLDCKFDIDLSKKRFEIFVNDPEIIDNGFIRDMSWREKILESDYIFGEDTKTSLKFTLYNCQVGITRENLKSPKQDGYFYIESVKLIIFWDSIIIGQHVPCANDLEITEMLVLAESKKQWFSHSVNKNCYKIEDDRIDVSVEFFEIKRSLYEAWNISRNGCLFRLKPLQHMTLINLKKSYKQLLDLYYLIVGFYPDNTRFWCNSETGNFIHISHTSGFMKSKNKDINFERSLYCSNVNDLSAAYENWVRLYKMITPIITVLKRAVCSNDDISEMLTATFIQCLEAYVSQQHKCQNESLSDIILKAINYNNLTKSVKKNIECFVLRIVEHREAADKLTFSEDGKYYKNKENTYAQMKLELLLRLCLLHDVGLSVKKESVDNYVAMIERNYPTDDKTNYNTNDNV